MRFVKSISFAVMAVILMAGTSYAGPLTATASANAVADVATPIGIEHKGGDLVFPKIFAQDTQQIIDSTGNTTFEISGEDSETYGYSVSDKGGAGLNKVTLKDNSGSGPNSMVASLTTIPSLGILDGGKDTLTTTGKLTVGASQAAGSYSGIFDVTVHYQ